MPIVDFFCTPLLNIKCSLAASQNSPKCPSCANVSSGLRRHSHQPKAAGTGHMKCFTGCERRFYHCLLFLTGQKNKLVHNHLKHLAFTHCCLHRRLEGKFKIRLRGILPILAGNCNMYGISSLALQCFFGPYFIQAASLPQALVRALQA